MMKHDEHLFQWYTLVSENEVKRNVLHKSWYPDESDSTEKEVYARES